MTKPQNIIQSPLFIYAHTPLHAGTSYAADGVELPIAREKSTSIPIIPGTTLKGILRDLFSPSSDAQKNIFGGARQATSQDTTKSLRDEQATENFNKSLENGHIHFSDASLLFLPVRSLAGGTIYVTSPRLLARWKAEFASLTLPGDRYAVVHDPQSKILHSNKVYLEGYRLDESKDNTAIKGIQASIPAQYKALLETFCIVHDDVMIKLMRHGTEIVTRVHIDNKTGTAAKGQLWSEELLPADSILIGSVTAVSKIGDAKATAQSLFQTLQSTLDKQKLLQIGGTASVGRGLCRLSLS